MCMWIAGCQVFEPQPNALLPLPRFVWKPNALAMPLIQTSLPPLFHGLCGFAENSRGWALYTSAQTALNASVCSMVETFEVYNERRQRRPPPLVSKKKLSLRLSLMWTTVDMLCPKISDPTAEQYARHELYGIDMYWYVLICIDMYWYVLICVDMYWYGITVLCIGIPYHTRAHETGKKLSMQEAPLGKYTFLFQSKDHRRSTLERAISCFYRSQVDCLVFL